MIEALERAIERVKVLDVAQQKFVADLLDELVDAGVDPIAISADEQAIVDRALAEIDAGDVATDDEVSAYRNRAAN